MSIGVNDLQNLDEDGVRIFAGFPHTHHIGSSIRLRHLRDGVERPVPFEDKYFNPNYQTMRGMDIQLMPVNTVFLTFRQRANVKTT